ncbi:MAG: hypothetical protein D6689_00685 [Deltaproteobacteria bacterium]|nr:MAG: hypothetical protein D6689_00685 [Deltaproteobacteria bacterium]
MTNPDAPCPLCASPLVDPRPLPVCGACHASLAGTGDAPAVTREFPVVSQVASLPAADAAATPPRRPRRVTHQGDFACTLCGTPGDQVKKLLTQAGIHICNECVALCADVLRAELGDDWR